MEKGHAGAKENTTLQTSGRYTSFCMSSDSKDVCEYHYQIFTHKVIKKARKGGGKWRKGEEKRKRKKDGTTKRERETEKDGE